MLTMLASWLLSKFAKRFDVKSETMGSTSDQTMLGEE